ncbi:MAG TPA: zinc ABC transporter substrate-binding protein [Acidimicrobiales bacterium]|nr:zinc ABC transporter substrate-binding protein [Acidimicrobiales bacterium]
MVRVIAAESQYANVAAQVGGRYVRIDAVMTNPDTDPHDFEASLRVASEINQAQIAVQNGLGYDVFMSKLEAADGPRGQMVVVAGNLVRNAPDEADNPHLWYYPATMPAVAAQVAADLGRLQPWHRRYFSQRLALFDRSLLVWHRALVSLRRSGRGVAVAVTEPVANYLLQAAGLRVATPRALQLAVMNGTDPAPQDIAVQDLLIERHRVKALVYNEQVQDGVTKAFLAAARKAHVPVVGVYETMPARSYDYQHWVLSTVTDLARSIGLSTAPRSKGGSGLAPSLPTAPRGGSRP